MWRCLAFGVVGCLLQAASAQAGLAQQVQAALESQQLQVRSLQRAPHATSALDFPGRWRGNPIGSLAQADAWLDGVQQVPSAALQLLALLDGLWRLAYGPPLAGDAPPTPPSPLPGPPPDMPLALRAPVQDLLTALAQAQAWQGRALSRWPAGLDASSVWPQVLMPQSDRPAIPVEHTLSVLLPVLDHLALQAGLRVLADAAQAFQAHLADPELPQGTWRWATPLGDVVIDTTGRSNTHVGQRPLLLIDRGGDDTYRFDRPARANLNLLFDHGGNDHYQSTAPGTDPSSATLGFALLWDSMGDDHYSGTWLAQGAAVLGAALHIDSAGQDHYQASGLAQGFALGGVGVLISRGGNDRYQALTQSSRGVERVPNRTPP